MKRIILALIVTLFTSSAAAASRQEFPGGWYCEAYPNGAQVVSIRGSHFETHAGRVDFPGQEPLYVRLSPDGSAFAGQGHADGTAQEFRAGVWRTVDALAFGVSPVIYLSDGSLLVSHGGPVGSQGYRFVDANGRVFTGDETYADPANHLWEYTDIPAGRFGQGGDEEGFQGVLANGRRVLVEPGISRFGRVNQQGDQVAFCLAKFAERKSVVLRMSVAELNALPTYVIPGHGHEPPPPPPPPPPPSFECGLVPQVAQDAIRALAARPDVNALVRSSDDEDRRTSARMFAEQARFLLGPEWGSKKADPGRPQTKDGIARQVGDRLCVWDIVNGTTRELVFGHGEDITGQVFIPVDPINHVGGSEPPPPPPPPPPSCNECFAVVDVLRNEIARLNLAIAADAAKLIELTEQLRAVTDERDQQKQQIDLMAAEIERLRAATCDVSPGWARMFGIRCTVKFP